MISQTVNPSSIAINQKFNHHYFCVYQIHPSVPAIMVTPICPHSLSKCDLHSLDIFPLQNIKKINENK